MHRKEYYTLIYHNSVYIVNYIKTYNTVYIIKFTYTICKLKFDLH